MCAYGIKLVIADGQHLGKLFPNITSHYVDLDLVMYRLSF